MSVPEGLEGSGQGLTRRTFLLAVGSASLLVACNGKAPATHAGATPAKRADGRFLQLSQALTGKSDLDPATAARIEAAFANLHPDMHAQFPALAAKAQQVHGAEALLAAVGDARPTALAIITAWYTGSVGKGPQAITVSYRDALMQRPVDDGLFPPTYAQGGPAWWTAEPPAAVRAHG
ncbi:sugar dehydrogenase complex small subunit [Stenotrophomonas sp. 1337]|uniref:sugar dehydrogenase complex small subunit n=1 Tax=Stenotrophomonas sp. 1337 TaxID=2817757 RepID=UPI002859230B|nr:sugar dehydrogenase complex small subunit [Stenotrophomonas sp. 1337]MDR6693019.1 hypothetical protein [Stenotrophomonas sp. 1337]